MTIAEIFKQYGIVTLREAESLTGIKADTLKKRIQKGKLIGFKVVDRNIIFLKDIEK